ncbi:gluconeogenesis factor YvcK family protein [Pseudothermotoga thermarum]|uniref:Putative gluconeogenesis factor n=1 Tax=Pseudothermotoga thermarum DSM 5069 TaxID=688269 RepID=F7YVG9_9THEM|nr:uridine diphosphate-N-acetylglucosamine-binding protein YvcK [Pseudothermotoga thermarum]AEH50480.1 protein of unknown function UPF0052 and CofD [Pseudothermotoga thermarum DSM 5069]
MKVVAIGGGTGLSVLLRGLKKYDLDISALVAVTDEGGSSGRLRFELEIPPPGDVRNNIIALANDEDLMSQIFAYRFVDNGSLHQHTVGNIIIAALTKMKGSFNEAVKLTCRILAIKGKVIPICDDLIRLVAKYDDGSQVVGETNITRKKGRIISIQLDKPAKASEEALIELSNADLIVLGPGSLYTSVITNLLVEGVKETIALNKRAVKIYVANIMTQPGETHGYTVEDHVAEVERYLEKPLDFVIVNNGQPPAEVLESYLKEGAEPVKVLSKRENYIFADLVQVIHEPNDPRPKIRHNSEALANIIVEIAKRCSCGKQ